MRYLISKKQQNSKRARQIYIYEAFHLFTLEKKQNSDFIVLECFPFDYVDILFIVGHDKDVFKYIKDNLRVIPENNIVIISCNSKLFKKLPGINKKIYIPKECKSDEIVKIYDGSKWGFDFNITDCEIDIYNDHEKNIETRIIKNMVKL